MPEPAVNHQENVRQNALREYHILHTGPEKDFDDITSLTAIICDMPCSLINLVDHDQVWHKSTYGTNISSTPRKESFCSYTISSPKDLTVIHNTEEDERVKEITKIANHHIRFYAGVPLKTPEGVAIGTLCVFDYKPHQDFEKKNRLAIKSLARQIMILLEQRKLNYQLQEMHQKVQEKNKDLEKFASIISHDIKSPLANIISLTNLLKEENTDNINEETKEYLNYLAESSYSLRNYVDGIITFYKSDYILDKEYEDVEVTKLLKPIVDLYSVNKDVSIIHPSSGMLHNVNKAALTQIFLNLISNALKYNSNSYREVIIDVEEKRSEYVFSVKDNGNGISEENYQKIFDLFATLDNTDRDGNPGSGIGLATVKKLVESMGGKINVSSVLGEGCTFAFSIQRL